VNNQLFVDKNIALAEVDLEYIRSIGFEVFTFDEHTIDYKKIEYLLLHRKLSDEQLLAMTHCKYIGIRAHNTDYVNKRITATQGIVVKGLDHQHGINAVAEHTFALIFSLAKNIVNSHRNIIGGKWRDNLKLNYELNHKKLGIIGHGQIGRRVAEIAKALGMEVLVAGKKHRTKPGEMTLNDVLKEADVISLHLSSGQENNHYIDRDCLRLMKKGSILINTARGSVLDAQALEEALEHGKFLGVGLDVFHDEPLLNSSLTSYSNVILTPHIAYMTNETLENMNHELFLNLKAFIGERTQS
jgi:phosphoglycerate dehydrogenase-like enzyme